jgi:hypothetical protein
MVTASRSSFRWVGPVFHLAASTAHGALQHTTSHANHPCLNESTRPEPGVRGILPTALVCPSASHSPLSQINSDPRKTSHLPFFPATSYNSPHPCIGALDRTAHLHGCILHSYDGRPYLFMLTVGHQIHLRIQSRFSIRKVEVDSYRISVCDRHEGAQSNFGTCILQPFKDAFPVPSNKCHDYRIDTSSYCPQRCSFYLPAEDH